MSSLLDLIRGIMPLESRFTHELKRRKVVNEDFRCTYRGVTYECVGRPGWWGLLEK